MADSTSADIVELIIDAKNLATDEITQTADELSALGATARKTEKDLEKLKIKQDTIASYKTVGESVKLLQSELDKAELAYEKMSLAIKANKNATDEEILAQKNAKRELNALTRELKDQEAEYRKLGKSLKQFEVDTKDLDNVQAGLSDQIKKTTQSSSELNQEYLKQADSLRTRIQAEKQSLEVAAKLEAAEQERREQLQKTTAEQEKLTKASQKAATVEAQRIADQKLLKASLESYEQQLKELVIANEKGTLSTAEFIRKEDELRQSLALTEGQTRSIRAALKAETDERKKAQLVLEQQVIQQKKLADQQTISAQKTREAATAEKLAAAEMKRVELAVKTYEAELNKLNDEKAKGTITTGRYIKQEELLRRNLMLSEAQVRVSRRAIEADALSRGKSVNNTDLLTTATRRLAQAYTVLIAAQKAAQAVGAGVKEYGELEAAITKVEKTTGLARDQVEGLAEQLFKMANDVTPTATSELLRYAEVAGQLGTKSTADLLNLVAAADALELSTDLAGDKAVELLARILTMTNEGIPEIQRLSSVVVALGNDYAASEADIAHMTKEIVSGTREINLSSAAAAAFGATLAELGQPAERSRTAIQRLSGAIKEAVLTGGEDLERLSKIAKMSGEDIAKALGKEPEKVLLAFLKGLDGINDSGGQMSSVLKRMGIDGTEALSVLGILAGGTNRLEEALKLSNEQWVAGNAHMIEAAKAYANQESSLGRLGNKFDVLKFKIGEAFSDDTANTVAKLGDVIDDTTESVVSLMEYVPEAVTGIVEALSLITDFVGSFISDEAGLGLVDQTINLLKASVNGLTVTIRLAILGMQDMALQGIELYNALQPLNDLKISTVAIDNLRKAMDDTAAAITIDLEDIAKAYDRIDGKSSIAFEGLITASNKYGEAVARLSEEQRKSIDAIVSKNQYSASENDLYRQLTAAIVRASRELEIETALKAQAEQLNAQSVETKNKEIAATNAQKEAQETLNATIADYTTKAQQISAAILKIEEQRKTGILTDQDAAAATTVLVDLQSRYNIVLEEHTGKTALNTKTTEENALARVKLFEEYQKGIISEKELADGMNALTTNVSLANAEIKTFAQTTEVSSLSQAKFAEQIIKTERKISDYKAQLKDTSLIEQDAIRIKASLVKEEEKLKILKQDQAIQMQVENANYGKLLVLQRDYQRQLDLVNKQFRAGLITKAQYEEKTRSLAEAINTINGIIRENTNALDDNTAATEKNTKSQEKKIDTSAKVTAYMSLELSAAQHLNKEYDFTTQSLEQLNKRQRELASNIVQNTRVTSPWLRNLADVSNQVFRQEQAVLSETIAMRELTEQMSRGTKTMSQLDQMAKQANNSLTHLSKNQLNPLLDAINKAKRELQELSAVADDAMADVQDRLDKALGNEQSIVKRRFEKELQEYTDLLDKAKAMGDLSLVNKLNEVLRKLKQAQDIEYKEQFGNNNKTAVPSAPVTRTASTPSSQQSNSQSNADGGSTVVLQLQVGGTKYDAAMERGTLNNMLSDINRTTRLGN